MSLDVTEAVIEEAKKEGCNMIVSHHPIIFSGIKRLTGSNYVQRCVRDAIRNDINLFAIHTNLDNVYDHGVNTNIAKIIGLKDIRILRTKPEVSENVGSGIIGTIGKMEEVAFLDHLKEKMALKCIKHTGLLGKGISKVAICGGSGRFLLNDAIEAGADVFISSDFKYHEYFDADGQIIIADIGHYESEQYTKNLIVSYLRKKISNFAIILSDKNTNPIQYI